MFIHSTTTDTAGEFKCKDCDQIISTGTTSSRQANTSNLGGHLSAKRHAKLFKVYRGAKEAWQKEEKAITSRRPATTKERTQLTLEETFTRQKPRTPDDPRSVDLDKPITGMVAVDCQPFTVVEDKGVFSA